MSYTLEFPIQYFPDSTQFGDIGLGSLYIGVVNGNPDTTPADRIQAYISRQGLADLAIPQPISISAGGVPLYQGSPVTLKINSAYSVAVLDYLGARVYYSARAGDEIDDLVSLDSRVDILEANEVLNVATFAALSSTPAVNGAGQIVFIRGHTTAGIGGGQFIAKAGSVATVSGIRINSATGGLYFERMVLHDIYDPWMTGATGVKAADEAAILICINEIKANNRGTLIIPSKISATAIVPAPALGNSQSIDIIDLRMDRTGGVQAFGVEEHWIEGKDSGGGYASELRVKGKQNPGFSMYPLSDGTAVGYPYANNMASIVGFNNAGENNAQWLTDPYSKGYKGDWAFEQYSAGAFTVSISMYAGVDLNKKTRFDLTPIQLSSAAINISSITNTTPIVVNTATPHGMAGQYGPVGILGTAITALNGSSWIAQNTGASQLTLLNSVASGAGGAAGTIGVQKNSQRATLNVPAIQGGTEAIVGEGKVVATGSSGIIVSEAPLGTAPVISTSQTADVNLHARPYIIGPTGLQQNNGVSGSGGSKIVVGFVTLAAGTATKTLTGDAVFVSASSYVTTIGNSSNANAVKVTQTSGNSITFTGTGTDTIYFICAGF